MFKHVPVSVWKSTSGTAERELGWEGPTSWTSRTLQTRLSTPPPERLKRKFKRARASRPMTRPNRPDRVIPPSLPLYCKTRLTLRRARHLPFHALISWPSGSLREPRTSSGIHCKNECHPTLSPSPRWVALQRRVPIQRARETASPLHRAQPRTAAPNENRIFMPGGLQLSPASAVSFSECSAAHAPAASTATAELEGSTLR